MSINDDDSFENMSEKRMLYETFLLQKQMDKRMDRHAAQHHEDINGVKKDNKSLREFIEKYIDIQSKSNSETGTRLTKLESEKSFLGRIAQPIITIMTGAFGVIVGKIIAVGSLFGNDASRVVDKLGK